MPRKTITTPEKPAPRSRTAVARPAVKRHRKATPVAAPDAPREIVHEEIAHLAYTYWEQRGFEGGSPDEDWYRAEQELRAMAAAV